MKSYHDLTVWQQAMDIVEEIYRLTQSFPRAEDYGLVSQMRRAAVSVQSNIAEGYTRSHRAEYVQHLSIAHGSLAELETQLEIAARLGYISSEENEERNKEVTSVGKQLSSMRKRLSAKRS